MEKSREKKGFICDMDGVIYHGNRLLDGVKEFVEWLYRENKEFLFLTNASRKTPKELQQKMSRLGLDISEEHFCTSALATAKFLQNQAPYGYMKGTDEKKLPIIDDPAASNVRRMFEMRASGISPNKIAQSFNDEGILTAADYKKQKFGIPNTRKSHHLWSCGTVKQVLNNPIYLGHLVQLRATNISYKNKKTVKRDPEDMVTVYNTHETIVTQEL